MVLVASVVRDCVATVVLGVMNMLVLSFGRFTLCSL